MNRRLYLLCLLVGCPVARDPIECDITLEVAPVLEAWPDAASALDARDVYEIGAVWYWSHGARSTDGFGATMALIDRKPGAAVLFDPIEDVPGRFKLRKPSLLFFDQTDGPPSEWPLVGMGYHYLFLPCRRPNLDCTASESFWVHEAGYHHVPLGDGGMHVATDDDLRGGASLDEAVCNIVRDEDLKPRLGFIRHGRAWTAHLWLDPEGGAPVFALEDPWERWTDATERVFIEPEVFLQQDPSLCDCATPAPAPRSTGCG